jgi:hypothetical protein
MNSRRKRIFCLAVVFAFCATTLGYEEHVTVPDPLKGYNWKDEAKKRGFTQKDIRRLEKDKILVTNETFKQVFIPYLVPNIPVFITSDSLLSAFHVLYEESVIRMEKANAKKLPEILRYIWKNLEKMDTAKMQNPELGSKAKKRGKIIIGISLKLLGDESIKFGEDIEKLINEEVKRIEAARGMMKPAWLGPPDEGFMALDYSRYKPRGFYTQTDELQRYFSVVSWLQSIPFRVSKDEELLSICLLGGALEPKGSGIKYDKKGYYTFFSCYESFIGTGDDWNLTDAAQFACMDKEMIIKISKGEYSFKAAINDQLRFVPDDPSKEAEPSFRIISAYRTPDAIMFQRTTEIRAFPNGLEVATALGSDYAREMLIKKEGKELIDAIDETKKFYEPLIIFGEGSLYLDYLDALAALLDEPEHDAPSFMSGESWKIKSCQTTLAGWSQLRHTWALQAKQNFQSIGLRERGYPGFVEPEPEFFKRMTDLIEKTESLLKDSGAFEKEFRGKTEDPFYEEYYEVGPDIEELWKELMRISRRLESLSHKQLRGVPLSIDENNFIQSFGDRLGGIMLYSGDSYISPRDDAPRVVDVFSNANVEKGYLEVGIARPRAVYVLYPVKGGEILCRGAVMPYYEFTCSERLTDEEWRELLKTKKRPKQPDWIKPINSTTETKSR